MRTRLTALIAAALLAGTAAAAWAVRPEVSASWAEMLTGHDAAGRVRVDFENLDLRHKKLGSFYTVQEIAGLRFANRCASRGTRVGATIHVRDRRFHYSRDGVTVIGAFNRRWTRVTGTVHVHTATCDSGRLSFTATGPGQP